MVLSHILSWSHCVHQNILPSHTQNLMLAHSSYCNILVHHVLKTTKFNEWRRLVNLMQSLHWVHMPEWILPMSFLHILASTDMMANTASFGSYFYIFLLLLFKLWNSLLLNIINCLLISSYLGPDAFLCTLFSDICNLCFSIKERDRFHTYTKWLSVISYIIISSIFKIWQQVSI